MQDHLLEHIRKNIIGSKHAALLIGTDAEKELRGLYKIIDGNKGLIEIMENETQFWLKFLGLIKREDLSRSDLEREVAVEFVESSLKNIDEGYHLFLPNVDKMFYRYDIHDNGLMGASLRRIWSNREKNLTIFGSVRSKNSKEFKKTFGKYEYPFYECCWLPVYLE